MQSRFSLALLAAVVATAGAAQGAYLTNTDFELTTGSAEPAQTFTGWTEPVGSAATVATSAISGTSSPKLVYVNAGNLQQATTDYTQLTKWTFEVDFAASDPGSATARSFNLNLRHATSGFNQINLRLVQGTGAGTIQIYRGGGWNDVIANSVTFSTSETDLQVNHLKVVADYSGTPTYDVFVTNALNNTTSLTGLSGFQGTAATLGANLRVISFETGNNVAGSWAVIDNVSLVPEPTAMALIGVGGLIGLRRRRA